MTFQTTVFNSATFNGKSPSLTIIFPLLYRGALVKSAQYYAILNSTLHRTTTPKSSTPYYICCDHRTILSAREGWTAGFTCSTFTAGYSGFKVTVWWRTRGGEY